jgi:hypothetical protein
VNTVHYSKSKLMLIGIGCPILALFALSAIGGTKGFVVFLLGISALFLFLVGPFALLKSAGDRVALRSDTNGLHVATLWTQRTVPWSEIAEIGIERLSFYTFFGLIKTSSTDYLVVKRAGGLFGGKKVRVVSGLLELGQGGLPALVEELNASRRSGATGAASDAISGYGEIARPRDPLEGAPRSSEFDPDAAIARYLANRSQPAPAPAPVPAARPAFGRKGL